MTGVIVFGALVCGVVGGGMLLSKSRVVSSSIAIAAPEDVVYGLLADLKSGWSRWSPLMTAAARGMDLEYGASTSGQGATVRWTGKAGTGSVTLTECVLLQNVTYQTTMALGGMVATGTVDVRSESPGTVVTWRDELRVGSNPVWRWLALGTDSFRQTNVNQGLAELKRVAEELAR